MITFDKTIPPVIPDHFTKATKDQIYAYLKEMGAHPSRIYEKHGAPIADTKIMIEAIEALEQEVLSKLRGTWIVTPATETTPAVYYQFTDKISLKNSLDGSYVPLNDWIDDFPKYYPSYDETRTFVQFKNIVQAE